MVNCLSKMQPERRDLMRIQRDLEHAFHRGKRTLLLLHQIGAECRAHRLRKPQPGGGVRQELLPVRLIVRASTAPPKSAP